MQSYKSELHAVSHPVNIAFERLSDLTVLANLKEKLNSPEATSKLEQIPETYRGTVKSTLEAIKCDKDSLSVQSPLGAITLRIIERKAPNLVRLQAENAPIPLGMTLNLSADGEQTSKLQVVIEAEVNMFMRGMVSGPLSKAAEGLASVLAMV
ncbi:MAG: hypothetical protein IJ786_02005 [Bacteroidaceae bacterium]|nr:hypothetical protein [Bacteroidaceae bacterium]